MSSGTKLEPTETYVLEETAITKSLSIEELAKLAGDDEAASSGDAGDEPEE